jgi:GNAT superfamily N-acetyltransferase
MPSTKTSRRRKKTFLFEFVEERTETPALDLGYHLTPWDEPAMACATAAISHIELKAEAADHDFQSFRDWCAVHEVKLVSCRLPQHRLRESGFLEGQGFRFIELNYRPWIRDLTRFSADEEIDVRDADPSDETEICALAGRTRWAGRLHVDPMVGPEIGDRRYVLWATNAFRHPGQRVLKCLLDGRIAAFLVVERPADSSRFWSLVALVPELSGKGFGRRICRSVLATHRHEGVEEVATSISSHNSIVHNLYVSLGFRFPPPDITLHWCPFGPLRLGTA